MYKTRDTSFLYKSKSQPATRNGSGCSTITTATSGYGTASSSNVSVVGEETRTSSRSSTAATTSMKFAESHAVFNFEKETFEFESSKELSLQSIQQLGNSNPQKDFHCWFGPSGSVTEKCAKCGILIKEKFVTAGDLVYHPKCFQCAKCGIFLGSGLHYEDNDNFYCKKDYLELFSERCSKCKKPLAEEYAHVGESLFHFKCFVCKVCSQKLDGYMEKDGEYYCDKHYQELFSPKCGKCRKLCKQKFYRTTDGAVFHHECFLCSGCGRRMKKHFISGGKYYCSTACGNK